MAIALPTVLILGEVPRLPAGKATLFIARITLAPGADTGHQIFPGPLGIFVESGAIDAEGPDGATVRLSAGRSLVLFAFNAVRARNPLDTPAVLLAIGLLPEVAIRAVGPTATPT
ncbi:MAG: hypothetical protein C4345_06500, partial [Chloroflexota bacterium]